mgnify:CR=1 FL=1
MKQNFEECMARLLDHEGGYVNHPNDPGGETNLGVTRAVYEQYAGRQVMDGEMEGLTHDDVYPIYKENYWDRVRGDDLPSGVDWSVFDWGVNSGTSRAAKALQRIIGVIISTETLVRLTRLVEVGLGEMMKQKNRRWDL